MITADVFDVLSLQGSVASRQHMGGTAPDTVRAAIQTARSALRSQSESAGSLFCICFQPVALRGSSVIPR
jgi:hypothetical protein